MSDWNFYKDYYKTKYDMILEQFNKKFDEAKIKITRGNISEYYDIDNTWLDRIYSLKDGFLFVSGNKSEPLNPDYITYVLEKSFYSATNISYNLNLSSLCTEIREKIKCLYNEDITEHEVIRMFEFKDWILRLYE